MIGETGLSTREACGNTVRNVTGDPWAGVCEDELFDPTPYVGAFARYWLRNALSQLLPRKFKVAFTVDRRGPRDHPHPRPRLRPAHPRDRRQRSRASRSAPAAAPRIMPRVGAPSGEFATVDATST